MLDLGGGRHHRLLRRARRRADRGADGPGDRGARAPRRPGIGGLLNVTFGNAPELIIALFALNEGLQEVVKASIIGSILGNLLLVLGAAMLVGGSGRERQKFVAEAASAQATMLLLATVALVLPAMFLLAQGGDLPQLGSRRRASRPRSSTCRSRWRSCCCCPTSPACGSR